MGTPRFHSFVRSLVGSFVTSIAAPGLLAGALAVGAVGCGGPSDPPPTPLGRHFDDSFLARVPIDQRQAEIDAKQAYDIAVLEKAKAKADFDESRVQLDVAKNERDAARLDEKSADSRAKAAQQSADMTRIGEADKELKAAKLARDAAEKRYEYIEAYRKWLQRLMRYTEHNAYWKEAQYELAQARIAEKNNIQPQGFKLDDYLKQEQDRAKKTADAKAKAEKEKDAAMAARSRWLALQGEADKMLGKKSEFPDPLAPDQVQGTDANAGAGGYTMGGGGASGADGTQPVQDPTMDGGDGSGGGSDGGSDDGEDGAE